MMKKVMFVLMLTMNWLISNGQLYPPIQPYQENDYSISQVKEFAMASTDLSSSWRVELLAIVNKGLADAGENMVLSESNINWILDHVVYESRKLTNFENSRNIFNKVSFYPDKNYEGMVGVFKYGKCDLVIYKSRCMNLLKVSVQIIVQTPPQTPVSPFVLERFVPAERDQNQYAYTMIKKTPEEFITPNLNLTSFKTIKTKTWFGRKWPWFVGTAVVGGVTSYLLLKQGRFTPLAIEPRTMPPGIPAKPSTPGLPSDPRNMPGGTGMSFGAGFSFRF